MAFRHEVLHIRRQQQCLIDIPGAKILAHSPSLNQTRSELNSDYSDRLLGRVLIKASQTAKPGQQRIIYGLRPLLLSPVAAAWKQVKPSQARQCLSHEGQAASEHLEN